MHGYEKSADIVDPKDFVEGVETSQTPGFMSVDPRDFYKRFKTIRREPFHHLTEHNPAIDTLHLVTQTQKLLDRFLLACFCEGHQLFPQD